MLKEWKNLLVVVGGYAGPSFFGFGATLELGSSPETDVLTLLAVSKLL